MQLGELILSIRPRHRYPPAASHGQLHQHEARQRQGVGAGTSLQSQVIEILRLFLEAVEVVGARLKGELIRSDDLLAKIDKLEVLTFDPTDAYVKDSWSSGGCRRG
eukprot:TRINITY_DN36970_c0_g1_i1.p1 TRINITY_DN36970_c0_g1~~TRINITY_DN36970_c0_g1_i1.p1  ORF type:complete len:106 (+),score=7.21 TRINITY_DN36970_c0_g1_i1:891-1208(+)